MTKPAFRVYITRHHGGLVSTVLLRRHRILFDPPPPAAMATDVETALRRLAPQAALLSDDEDQLARYLWTEQLELRRVDVDIHPGRPDPHGYVISRAEVPIRLGYAAAKLDGAPLHRVIVPRFDWSFVTEELATVPDTLRAHLAARRELERVLEVGGGMPPNPDVLLPVTRTIAYRAPLRPSEPYAIEIEDFATGWVDRGRAHDLVPAIRRAWYLAWSRR